MTDFTIREFKERLDKLQTFLSKKGVALAVLNQTTDIYYYTGSVQPLYLLVPATGTPLLLARKSLSRISNEIIHLDLEAFSSTKDLTRIIARFQIKQAQSIGLTLDTTAYATAMRWQQLFGGAALADLSLDIRLARLVKSAGEIAILTKAGEIVGHLLELVKANFQPGLTELELSAIIENYFRLNGHGVLVRCRREGIECLGVCSAGTNTLVSTKFDGVSTGVGLSPAIPYGASLDPIPENVPVFLDYAFNLQGYHVDQTRMFCWGKPEAAVTKAYQAMLQVEKAIMADLAPGRLWCEVYEHAVNLAVELGYEAGFMGLGNEKVRFVGHGIGLELDEPPFLAPKMEYQLAAGMVVAIEPKVALPGIGVVGIEDTVVVTDSGCEKITGCSQEFMEIPSR